jgi:hypothetical protein
MPLNEAVPSALVVVLLRCWQGGPLFGFEG